MKDGTYRNHVEQQRSWENLGLERLEGFWALREFGDPENFWKRKMLLMEKTGPIYTKV